MPNTPRSVLAELKLFQACHASGMGMNEALGKRLAALEKMIRRKGLTIGGPEHRILVEHVETSAIAAYEMRS